MSLEREVRALREQAILEKDLALKQACDRALQRIHKEKRVRKNPPLDDHMSDESYDDIFHALAQRIMQEPVDAIEFAYSVLDTAKEGLLRYSEISVEKDEASALGKAESHIEKALLCIRKALEKLDA